MTGTAGSGASSFAIVVKPNGTISTVSNAALTLIGDSMDIAGSASISTGAGIATLRQKTNVTRINLGGADAAGTLGLTDAELDTISAGTLKIGDANSGAITVAPKSRGRAPPPCNSIREATSSSAAAGSTRSVAHCC